MSNLKLSWPGNHDGKSNEAAVREPAAAVVLPDEGQVLHAFGDQIMIHLGGADTGGGPPPHYHENEDEWFLPLEGQVSFLLEGAWKEVPLGSVVFAPRGTVHTFKNTGDAPLRMLTQVTPGGMEVFFERCAAVFAEGGPPDMGLIVEISAEHGIFFVTD